jgi:hypothetical protein
MTTLLVHGEKHGFAGQNFAPNGPAPFPEVAKTAHRQAYTHTPIHFQ